MLELDFVLERYLDDHFESADMHEKVLFAELLTAQDPELQAWLLKGVDHPDNPLAGSLVRWYSSSCETR